MAQNQPPPQQRNVDVDQINDPTIDSIKTATQRISNWLHEDLREIIKPLQNLHSLPKDIGDLKKRLVEEFRKLFSGQIKAEMKSREANIRVAERKAELAEEHVQRKEEQLEESQERVRTRYEKLAESVQTDHRRNLERLDSHAYRITEEIYPDQIQDRFSYESPVFWQALAEHSTKAAAARTSALSDGREDAGASVSALLDARESFREELRRLATPDADAGAYELPYWFVEVVDEETDEKRLDVLFPWDLHDTDPPVDAYQEESLREAARAKVEEQDSGRPLTDEERNRVLNQISSEHDVDPATLFEDDGVPLSVSLPDVEEESG